LNESFLEGVVWVVSEMWGIKQDTVKKDLETLLNDSFVKDDPQFKEDKDRIKFALSFLNADYAKRQPFRREDRDGCDE
jgi:hypothetical protein